MRNELSIVKPVSSNEIKCCTPLTQQRFLQRNIFYIVVKRDPALSKDGEFGSSTKLFGLLWCLHFL